MIRNEQDGQAIALEIWSLPSNTFGSFVAGIAAPLGLLAKSSLLMTND